MTNLVSDGWRFLHRQVHKTLIIKGSLVTETAFGFKVVEGAEMTLFSRLVEMGDRVAENALD
jgi:hypothetical protein